MKFCWSTLKVNNLDESIHFYRDIIGLPLNSRFQTEPGMEIAFLGNGDTKIELVHSQAAAPVDTGKDISWGFEVESVDGFIEFLKEKGIAIYEGPFAPAPHTKFFYVKDPNGMKIQFVENRPRT